MPGQSGKRAATFLQHGLPVDSGAVSGGLCLVDGDRAGSLPSQQMLRPVAREEDGSSLLSGQRTDDKTSGPTKTGIL